LNGLMLAALRFPDNPTAAAETLAAAARAAADPEQAAQLRFNLTLMYSRMGELAAAETCATEAIRAAQGRVSPARMLNLRIQRAWAWADLDRIDAVLPEAEALLATSEAQFVPERLVPIRLLLGYSSLHQGFGAPAIRDTFLAWKEAEQVPEELRLESLRYLMDTVLDLNEWEFLSDQSASIGVSEQGDNPLVRTTAIRWRAIVAQQQGRLDQALEILESGRAAAARLEDRLSAARYLHHLGLLYLAQAEQDPTAGASIASAEADLQTELTVLPASGQRYWRGRALLHLSLAQRAAGKRDRARRGLTTAIAHARSIRSRGLLLDCLLAQAGENGG
jgi:tetratricopeptide (TPR) repeat protein